MASHDDDDLASSFLGSMLSSNDNNDTTMTNNSISNLFTTTPLSTTMSNTTDDNLSDAEDFSMYSGSSLDLDDNNSNLQGFSKLSAIDGDMHITGIESKSKRRLKHLHQQHKLTDFDDDDDFISDDEINPLNDDDIKDSFHSIADNDDVANMRTYTTIEDLLRPPTIPPFSIIKPQFGQTTIIPTRPNHNTMGKKTVRFSNAPPKEREFLTTDPAAKANIYAGLPGLEPPSTYIGIPMELKKDWVPTIQVNPLRTATSTIKFSAHKKMITSCIPTNSKYQQSQGFDSSCEIGFYDLTSQSKLKQHKLNKWDRYINRITQRQNEITNAIHTIDTTLSTTPTTNDDTNTKDINELKRSRDQLLLKQSMFIQEKQQNIFTGGGPSNSCIGIGYYRLLQTIHQQPPSEVSKIHYNPPLLSLALPKLPSTFPLLSIQPHTDTFILQTSYFPSIQYQSPSTTQTTTNTTSDTNTMSDGTSTGSNKGHLGYIYKNSYLEQVILATKPRGHCETLCSILEQRRIQQLPTSKHDQNEVIVIQLPLQPTTTTPSFFTQLIQQYITIQQQNGTNDNDNETTMDNGDGNGDMKKIIDTKLQQLLLGSIPYALTQLLPHYQSLHPMFEYFYKNNNYQQKMINNDFGTDIITSFAQLFFLDRLSFYSLSYPPSTTQPTQTELKLIKSEQISNLLKKFQLQQLKQSNNMSLMQYALTIKLGSTIQPVQTSYSVDTQILTTLSLSQQQLKYRSDLNSTTNNNSISNTGHAFMTDISFLQPDDILYHNSHLESGEFMSLIDAAPFGFNSNTTKNSFLDDLDLLSGILTTNTSINDDDNDKKGDMTDTSSIDPTTPNQLSRSTSMHRTPSSLHLKPTITEFNMFESISTPTTPSSSTLMNSITPYQSQPQTPMMLNRSAPNTPSLSALKPKFAKSVTQTPNPTQIPSQYNMPPNEQVLLPPLQRNPSQFNLPPQQQQPPFNQQQPPFNQPPPSQFPSQAPPRPSFPSQQPPPQQYPNQQPPQQPPYNQPPGTIQGPPRPPFGQPVPPHQQQQPPNQQPPPFNNNQPPPHQPQPTTHPSRLPPTQQPPPAQPTTHPGRLPPQQQPPHSQPPPQQQHQPPQQPQKRPYQTEPTYDQHHQPQHQSQHPHPPQQPPQPHVGGPPQRPYPNQQPPPHHQQPHPQRQQPPHPYPNQPPQQHPNQHQQYPNQPPHHQQHPNPNQHHHGPPQQHPPQRPNYPPHHQNQQYR